MNDSYKILLLRRKNICCCLKNQWHSRRKKIEVLVLSGKTFVLSAATFPTKSNYVSLLDLGR